ncbi:MAG: enoyl-CoA hydratase/isomerase family protein [Deltaproteobacteria bacterium]|nr:enoyl-CoA hydratase/isomerase family protein [Deltaproteobacteria bacterium]
MPTVIEKLEAGVLLLTLNRPEARNAFNAEQWRETRLSFQRAMADDAVRVVVVTGAGGAFTAGQDLGEMGAIDTSDASAENGFSLFMDELVEFDKPLIAAVNGVGVGFGLTMLLYCDYVYMSRDARLRAPFITLGVVPEAASSYLLPVICGWRAAVDLLFESDFIDADRALELQLATQLCQPEQVLGMALEGAARLAAKPLGSLRHTKRLLIASRNEQVVSARRREDKAFMGRIGSAENIEAITAFIEKRTPDFDGVPPHDKDE